MQKETPCLFLPEFPDSLLPVSREQWRVDILKQITPVRIALFYQLDLPFSGPALEARLALNGSLDITENLKPNELARL